MTNELARWNYHVPLGWQAYWVCSTPSSCPAGAYTDRPMVETVVDKTDEVRFRPVHEPKAGGYSLRVRILDNTFVDVHQTVGTKITGFRDSSEVADFNVIHEDDHSVYFEYRDASSNLHRFNFFQWFAVPDQTGATLEMSVSGRKEDVAGLKALFNRFADNVMGTEPPAPPEKQEPHQRKAPSHPATGQPREPRVRTESSTPRAVFSSSPRTCTHRSRLELTCTARSMITPPPAHPVEIAVSAGSPSILACGAPGFVHDGCWGRVFGRSSSGTSPTKTP